jgi:hypothetical protein
LIDYSDKLREKHSVTIQMRCLSLYLIKPNYFRGK